MTKRLLIIMIMMILMMGIASLEASQGKIPIYFIPNQGQVASEVLYYASTPGFTMWATREGLVFDTSSAQTTHDSHQHEMTVLQFHGNIPEMQITPSGLTAHQVHYLKGDGKKDNFHNIPTYSAILYQNVYKNIDLKVYGTGNHIEYDWIVRKGGNAEDIQFTYNNPSRSTKSIPHIDSKGNLLIKTAVGDMLQKKPVAFQSIHNKKIPVKAHFQKISTHTENNNETALFGFKLGSHRKDHDLVIDPVVLSFSTYLGVDSENSPASSLAVDASGSAYITGSVTGAGFPTVAPFQTSNAGEMDVFIAKLSPTGDSLIYSTYLGGSGNDYGQSIAVDANGCAIITGYTASTNFPLKNAFQTTAGGTIDAFVTKLSPGGNTLEFSTYIGGKNNDRGRSIKLDNSGNIYVAGDTSSTNFPLQTPYMSSYSGNMAAFITKWTPTGSSLIYSTYLGGSGSTRTGGIDVDSSGCLYITGTTGCEDFPVVSAYQWELEGGTDAFVTKLSSSGNNVIYSTYLGGTGADVGNAIAIGTTGDAYITGSTYSADFPTLNPIQKQLKLDKDLFVTRLTSAGNDIVYSTYLGGESNGEEATAISVLSNGSATLAGFTSSPDFPSSNAYQTDIAGGSDVFITTLSPNGTSLDFSTFLGGKQDDNATSIQLANGSIYVAGYTTSTDFPTQNPVQGTYNGSINPFGAAAFVVHFAPLATLPPAPPFGSFDSPAEGASTSGSIIVTGWALDNGQIPNVKIYIDNPYEPGLIYIGDALFVSGARPDVQGLYPEYPFSNKAGWGYMMLTHFLPGGGNGTYKLHAIATDNDGNSITLDTRTIINDNAHAIKPFGAIDTPAPGETVSGSYRNIGWTLTPLPNQIPENGSTITVFIDGQPIAHPVYNIYRTDIATLFPGYANSNGAMAYYDFNSAKYKNGVHTIAWAVTDSAGNTEGIGSRYFNIRNSNRENETANSNETPLLSQETLETMLEDTLSPVTITTGYRLNETPQIQYPKGDGKISISIKANERLTLRISPSGTDARLTGCAMSLPDGASFNDQTGTLYWQPGPGCAGTHCITLIETRNGINYKKNIIVTISE